MKLLFDDIKLVLVKLTGGFDQPILTKFLSEINPFFTNWLEVGIIYTTTPNAKRPGCPNRTSWRNQLEKHSNLANGGDHDPKRPNK